MPSSAGGARGITGLTAAALLALACSSCTMSVRASVRDQSGGPVKDAVVYASPEGKAASSVGGRPGVAMTVENLEFFPPVLPVRVGGGVTFLNRDDVAHQIYSISRAKNFERFVGRLSASGEVVFDRPGPVVVGCATHDSMTGHIYVVGTPYFAVTGADGTAELHGLPRAVYGVQVWHPDMQASDGPARKRVSDTPSHRAGVDFTVSVQRRPPAGEAAQTAPNARGDER